MAKPDLTVTVTPPIGNKKFVTVTIVVGANSPTSTMIKVFERRRNAADKKCQATVCAMQVLPETTITIALPINTAGKRKDRCIKVLGWDKENAPKKVDHVHRTVKKYDIP